MGEKIGGAYYEIGAKDDGLYKSVARSKKIIRSLENDFKIAENRAKVFGNTSSLLAEKQSILANRMNSLLEKGVKPNNKGFKKLEAQYRDVTAQIDRQKKSYTKFIPTLKQVGIAAAVGFGAMYLAAAKAIKAASDLEETSSKFAVTFSDVGTRAQEVADELQNAYGLSERESKALLSSTGDLLTGFGFTGKAALDLSEKVNKLSVDLASFQNLEGGTEQASQALTKALLGETESAKSLGIVIRQNDVTARLAAKGLDKLTGSALQQAKAQVTFDIAMEQSTNAIGDFNRTSNSTANVFRRVASRTEDLTARLGKGLLPSVTELGIAFLEATEDGGFLEQAMSGVVSVAKGFITAITTIIEKLNSMNKAQKEQNALVATGAGRLDEQIANARQYDKTLGELIQKARDRNASEEEIAALEDRRVKNMQDIDKLSGERLAKDQLLDDILVKKTKTIDNLNNIHEKEKAVVKDVTKASRSRAAAEREAKKAIEERAKAQEEAQRIIREFGLTEIQLARQQGEDRNSEIRQLEAKRLITHEQANDLILINELNTQKRLEDIRKEAAAKTQQNALAMAQMVISGVGNLLNALSNLVSVNLQVALADINAQLEATLAAIDEQTQAELEAAGLLEESQQEQTETEIATLEEKLTRTRDIAERLRLQQLIDEKKQEAARQKILDEAEKKKLAAEAEAEAERRKRQREAAQIQKDFSIAGILLSTPLAAMRAYAAMAGIPVVGPGLGAAAATLAIAAGAVQLEAARRTPIPAAAEGGIVNPANGGQLVQVAEAGQQEGIFPLTPEVFAQLGAAISQNIGGAGALYLTLNIGGETLYAEVNRGVEDGHIIINESDLVRG